MTRPARPMGQHDTTELERLQRSERRAFFYGVVPACVAVLLGAAHVAGVL